MARFSPVKKFGALHLYHQIFTFVVLILSCCPIHIILINQHRLFTTHGGRNSRFLTNPLQLYGCFGILWLYSCQNIHDPSRRSWSKLGTERWLMMESNQRFVFLFDGVYYLLSRTPYIMYLVLFVSTRMDMRDHWHGISSLILIGLLNLHFDSVMPWYYDSQREYLFRIFFVLSFTLFTLSLYLIATTSNNKVLLSFYSKYGIKFIHNTYTEGTEEKITNDEQQNTLHRIQTCQKNGRIFSWRKESFFRCVSFTI